MSDPNASPAAAPAVPTWEEARFTPTRPITLESGEVISEIVFTEPTVETLEVMERLGITPGGTPSVSQVRGMMEAFARLPEGSLRSMSARDFTALSEVFGPFAAGVMG